MAQVVLERLTKVFPGAGSHRVSAVDNLSLVVEDKELLVLVGPSGCGKTTTLRLIAGLEEPTAGTISINGQVVNRVPPKDRDIAMVFQNHALFPHMSVFENMAFGLQLRHYPKADVAQRVKHSSQILGLDTCLNRLPSEISGGQRQRVALGRAMVRQPGLFLLDEPFSDLDAQTRLQLRAETTRLHRRLGATMIYVTHDQVEALTLGHRIAVMNQGALQQVADPMTLYRYPANLFVAGFIGAPPMNFFGGTLQTDGDALCFQEQAYCNSGGPKPLTLRMVAASIPVLRPFAGKQVVLGIRPEDITCGQQPPDSLPGGALEAVVELVQPLGSETYLHLVGHTHPIVARVRATEHYHPNQQVSLTIELRQSHFFNPASGKAILQPHS